MSKKTTTGKKVSKKKAPAPEITATAAATPELSFDQMLDELEAIVSEAKNQPVEESGL